MREYTARITVMINLSAASDEKAHERAEDIADALILAEVAKDWKWLDFESMEKSVDEVEEVTI